MKLLSKTSTADLRLMARELGNLYATNQADEKAAQFARTLSVMMRCELAKREQEEDPKMPDPVHETPRYSVVPREGGYVVQRLDGCVFGLPTTERLARETADLLQGEDDHESAIARWEEYHGGEGGVRLAFIPPHNFTRDPAKLEADARALWSVRVLDAWADVEDAHWSMGNGRPSGFSCGLHHKAGGMTPHRAETADAARHAAALAVLPTLSAAKQAELGECP